MVVDELDALRDRFDGCMTVAFADLSAQMILVTDSTSNLSREVLDTLCAEAAMTLGTGGKPSLGTQPSAVSVVAGKQALRLFIRATVEPGDVLCCICKPDVDVDVFLLDARTCLDRISSG